jgi:hypothetical protein
MTRTRNEDPLHDHDGVNAGPWTQDTMLAHLRHLHGVGQLPDDAPLAELASKHDELNHGAGRDEKILAEALAPGRRYKSITLGEARWGRPGDAGLCFEDANGTNIVNLRPGDLPVLRAAVIPESGGLESLKDIWSANLGPGGRRAVEAGHAAGYRLGVDDMENTPAYRTAPVDAYGVLDWLLGLYESGAHPADAGLSGERTGEDQDAISRVRDLIQRRLAGQQAARRG